MKFKIKGDEKDPTVELWLEQEGSTIILIGKDVTGKIKDIMVFKSGGFARVESAELKGLNTDDGGRIKETS